MNKIVPITALILLGVTSCIKDDFVDDAVDPVLRITNGIDSLNIDSTFQMNATYFNNVGIAEQADLLWESSDQSVLTIDQSTGLIQPLTVGTSTISVRKQGGDPTIFDTHDVAISMDAVVFMPGERTGTIQTTTFYQLAGDFVLREDPNGTDLILDIASNYVASSGLPGLYVYLTNNPNSIAAAHEIGAVQVFSGAHSYTIQNVGLNDYSHILYFCAPFNVKVGDGLIN